MLASKSKGSFLNKLSQGGAPLRLVAVLGAVIGAVMILPTLFTSLNGYHLTLPMTEPSSHSDTLLCLNSLPKWILDHHSDTLGKEFNVGSNDLTDKSTLHSYQLIYHRYLARRAIQACLDMSSEAQQKQSSHKIKFRMLEIGLGCAPGGGMKKGQPGGSTLAWRHLFPQDIFDLDLHVMEYDANCAIEWHKTHPGIATMMHTGDASSATDLDRVIRESGGDPFDMIVDDASHINAHQIFTVQHLIKHVTKGGIYVIEDIHSACFKWKANVGTEEGSEWVDGTSGCMETKDGKPTIFAKLVEWQKPLVVFDKPFEDVTHIDIGYEIAVISKEY